MNTSRGLAHRLDALEAALPPRPPDASAGHSHQPIIVITCTDDPKPPEGSLAAWLATRTPCSCGRPGALFVRWDGAAWDEDPQARGGRR